LKKLVAKINDIKPDLVVNLGDTIEDLRDVEADTRNLQHVWKLLSGIKSRFYCVPGNHDMLTLSRRQFLDIIGYETSTFSVDIGGYHFVFLGLDDKETTMTTGYKMKMTISQSDIGWLENDIKQNKLPSIVFTHFALADDDMKGNFWFDREPQRIEAFLDNRDQIKRVLKTDKNLLGVFSGHQHWTKTIIEDGISYHVVGSLTENLKGDGKPDGVWLEVDILDKVLKIKQNNL